MVSRLSQVLFSDIYLLHKPDFSLLNNNLNKSNHGTSRKESTRKSTWIVLCGISIGSQRQGRRCCPHHGAVHHTNPLNQTINNGFDRLVLSKKDVIKRVDWPFRSVVLFLQWFIQTLCLNRLYVFLSLTTTTGCHQTPAQTGQAFQMSLLC